MFIPPNRLKHQFKPSNTYKGKIRLKSLHLLINHEVASSIFENELNVNVVYYTDRRSLMIAPESEELFKQLHKAKQHMLKNKNAEGDRSIALHELLK